MMARPYGRCSTPQPDVNLGDRERAELPKGDAGGCHWAHPLLPWVSEAPGVARTRSLRLRSGQSNAVIVVIRRRQAASNGLMVSPRASLDINGARHSVQQCAARGPAG